jgi:hypothetical protein
MRHAAKMMKSGKMQDTEGLLAESVIEVDQQKGERKNLLAL